MDKIPCRNELKKVLETELQHTESLHQLLVQEKSALVNDPETLTVLSDKKQVLISQLEKIQHHANAFLQDCGFSPDRQGMESCISWCDTEKNILPVWKRLTDHIKECRKQNHLNGSIMENGMRSIKQALAILHGKVLQQDTYNANGTENNQSIGKTIAKA